MIEFHTIEQRNGVAVDKHAGRTEGSSPHQPCEFAWSDAQIVFEEAEGGGGEK